MEKSAPFAIIPTISDCRNTTLEVIESLRAKPATDWTLDYQSGPYSFFRLLGSSPVLLFFRPFRDGKPRLGLVVDAVNVLNSDADEHILEVTRTLYANLVHYTQTSLSAA